MKVTKASCPIIIELTAEEADLLDNIMVMNISVPQMLTNRDFNTVQSFMTDIHKKRVQSFMTNMHKKLAERD